MRRYETYWSMTLVPMLSVVPHTDSRMSERDSVLSGFVANSRSSVNSRRLSGISCPETSAWCSCESIVSRPTLTWGRIPLGSRRSSARTRAASSANANGLVR